MKKPDDHGAHNPQDGEALRTRSWSRLSSPPDHPPGQAVERVPDQIEKKRSGEERVVEGQHEL